MIKQLNRILKLVGFNLVRAKRKKWAGRVVVSTAGPETDNPLLPKCSDVDIKAKLSDYMGETEWQDTPPRPPFTVQELQDCGLHAKRNQPHPFHEGKTHYYNDGCEPPHIPPTEAPRVEQPHSDNRASGPTS